MIFGAKISYKKLVNKMLMKLTPVVNIIYILHARFSYGSALGAAFLLLDFGKIFMFFFVVILKHYCTNVCFKNAVNLR